MNQRETAILRHLSNSTKFPDETFLGLSSMVKVNITITATLSKLKQLHHFLDSNTTSNELIEQKLKRAIKPQHRHAEIGHRMCQYYVCEELKIQKSFPHETK